MSLARTTRISRHARIPGDCPVCLYPLQGRNITKRPCQHMLCTPCYHDGVQLGSKDSSFNPDACEQCRDTPCTKTRIGSTLMEHYQTSKQLSFTPAAAATKEKGESRGGNLPRLSGPSAGSRAVSAGSKSRGQGKAKRLAKRKANAKAVRESNDDGGFTSTSRGKVRRLGVNVPVGNEHTCLQDSVWVGAHDVKPDLELQLRDIRAAMATSDGSDPKVSMANSFLEQHGLTLQYMREINNPKALFKRKEGAFLVRLAIKTDLAIDHHFVTYLASTGFLIDNYPGQSVPMIEDIDRASNKQAMRAFKKSFPGASQIQMTSVYEFQTCCQIFRTPCVNDSCASGVSYRRLIGPPNPLSNTWSSTTKPTLEDLFFELYDEQIINYSELIDCIK